MKLLKNNDSKNKKHKLYEIQEQLKPLKMIGYTTDDHMVIGNELFQQAMKTTAVIINSPNIDMSKYKYNSREEMFQGADFILFDYKWHKKDYIKSDTIMPLKDYKEKIKTKEV